MDQDNYSCGCQSCQKGSWLCIFLTYLCNANCSFCISPFKHEDKIISAFGNDPQIILDNIIDANIDGISFSGGECCLVFERLIEWLSFFKKHLPKVYYWIYTNGLALDEKKLMQLSDSGLDEIRFNIAATNYSSKKIISIIAKAAQIFENVTVEIPSIPSDYNKLVRVLPILDEINVGFLNLHQYILTPDDPQSKQTNVNTFISYENMKVKYHPGSLMNTKKIKEFCRKSGLKLKINNCSFLKKENQMRLRRLAMGKMFKNKFEVLTEEGVLETLLVFPKRLSEKDLFTFVGTNAALKKIERYQINPKKYYYQNQYADGTIAKLTFLPPMSIDASRVLLGLEILNREYSKI